MRTTDFSKAPPQARSGAMFIGATKYSGPLSLIRLSRTWSKLVRDMKRMDGYRWHKVWWEFPFTLGTIAFFEDTDALMKFARTRHHRDLVCWVTDNGTKYASGGWIRIFTAEPGGYSNGVWRAEDGTMAHIEDFTALSTEQAGPPVHRAGRSGGA
ncbi:DUF4188 domain-containing protein [Streptomycetaceae bacterium NBC_01309]